MNADRPTAGTVLDLLEARGSDDAPGLRFEGAQWSWAEVVALSERRAAVLEGRPGSPPHLGVLLDNVPEYLWWTGAAAMAGWTVVGINPTRRGEELARDIRATDCCMLVTDAAGEALLDGLDTGVGPDAVLRVEDGPPQTATASGGARRRPEPEDLLMLLFTSGTTGSPKAVRCTQGRLAAIARRAAALYDFRRDDVCYCPMPLFHGNAVMALWAPALATGSCIGLTRRFSASRFLEEVRELGATRFTYVGKALAYVLATPERPDDAENPLRIGFGTEASAPDREDFERRFGCRLVEGYGSSEGGITIQVGPDTPPGALGKPPAGEDVAVCDPDTGAQCPPARFDTAGRLLNAEEAVGEIVNRGGARGFEGYYADTEAQRSRTRRGWYWSGDLAYRDEEGWFYFAGRGGDWLRVDSENFAAAPVERILERHPDVAAAALYPVPDPRSGDMAMAALELRRGACFDAESFARWLGSQPDLGTKWAPRVLRLCPSLPLTATGKITKTELRRQGWECDDELWWSPGRRLRYERLDRNVRARLRAELARHNRFGPGT